MQLIWAFNAADGSKLTHFPVRVPGRVAAELTLAALSEIDVCEAPTILAGADDGACESYNDHTHVCLNVVVCGVCRLSLRYQREERVCRCGRSRRRAARRATHRRSGRRRSTRHCGSDRARRRVLPWHASTLSSVEDRVAWSRRLSSQHTWHLRVARSQHGAPCVWLSFQVENYVCLTLFEKSNELFLKQTRLTFEIVDNGPRAIHSTYDVTLRVGFSNTPLLRQTFDAPVNQFCKIVFLLLLIKYFDLF